MERLLGTQEFAKAADLLMTAAFGFNVAGADFQYAVVDNNVNLQDQFMATGGGVPLVAALGRFGIDAPERQGFGIGGQA